MTLTQLLETARTQASVLSIGIPEDWMQGRSAYGGLQAALAARAMLAHADGLPIRCLQATLMEPVAGVIECHSRLLRSSKNTRQIETRIFQGEQLCASFIGIFGRPRESVVRWTPPRRMSSDKEMVWPYVEGISPQFLRHFDICMLKGHPVGAGQADTEHMFRISLKDDVTTTQLPQVLVLADFPPPIGLSWIKGFTPGSTMTWMLNFTGEPVEGHALGDWTCEVSLNAAREGYTDQTVSLYAPGGQLILRGTQCMVVFA